MVDVCHATARRPICNAVATLPTKSGSHFSGVEASIAFSFRAAYSRGVAILTTAALTTTALYDSVVLPFILLFTVSMAKYCRHVKFSKLELLAAKNPLKTTIPQHEQTNDPRRQLPSRRHPDPDGTDENLIRRGIEKNQNYSFGSISSPGTRPLHPNPASVSTPTQLAQYTSGPWMIM